MSLCLIFENKQIYFVRDRRKKKDPHPNSDTRKQAGVLFYGENRAQIRFFFCIKFHILSKFEGIVEHALSMRNTQIFIFS